MSANLPDLICDSRILVIDDATKTCTGLQTVLRDYNAKEIIYALDGFDALDKLDTFTPDLILLNISSSNMNWLEFCTTLRKGNESSHTVPIIAITDMDKTDERVKILKFNVSGVLHKPVLPEELANSLNLHLQKSRLMKRLEECEEPTALDLEIARNMQYTLLPDEDLLISCKENYNVTIQHLYKSSQALGGDYWAVKQLENSRLMICVADFAGHGVSVALDTFRLHNYLMEFVNYSNSPAKILEDMNDSFYRILPTGQYLTCFFGIIDTAKSTITYSGAAVPPAILINSGEAISLDCSGTPIGAYPKAEYTEQTIPFTENSALLIYSDALIEINADNKTLFTKDSLFHHVEQWSADGVDYIYNGIVKRIEQTSHRFDDDLTLVLLDLNPKP